MQMTRSDILAQMERAASDLSGWRWKTTRPQLRSEPAKGVLLSVALHLTVKAGQASAAPVLDLQSRKIARLHKSLLGRVPAAGALRYQLAAGPIKDAAAFVHQIIAQTQGTALPGLDLSSEDALIKSLPDAFRRGGMPEQEPLCHIIGRIMRGQYDAVQEFGFNPTVPTSMLDKLAGDLDAIKAARDTIPRL